MRQTASFEAREVLERKFTRFASDLNGATAVEFGLIAVPFLGLLLATFNMGLSFFVERNLDTAIQNASRQIRTGAAQAAAVATSQQFINTYVCPATGGLLDKVIDCTKLIVDIRTTTTLIGNDLSNDFYKTQAQNQFCLGAPQTITIVRVAYPLPWYLPVITYGGVANTAGLVNDVPLNAGWKLLLVSASAIKTEPYPAANYQAYKTGNGC